MLPWINNAFAQNTLGFIYDGTTHEPIMEVNIQISNTSTGTTTNNEGFFILYNVETDTIYIRLSHIAYRDTALNIVTNNKPLHKIFMVPSVLEGQQIFVESYKRSIIQKDIDITSFFIRSDLLSEVPIFDKDVFKVLKYTPSVTYSNPLSPFFYVRGSDSGENKFALDGITVYNPHHFLTSGAIFNPHIIRDVEMLMGGFDARFGGRNGSLMNISTRDGRRDRISGEFHPSTSGIEGALDLPIKDITTVIAARFKTSNEIKFVAHAPNFRYDFNFNASYRTGPLQLKLTLFRAKDFFDFDVRRLYPDKLGENSFSIAYKSSTNNEAHGLRVKYNLSPKVTIHIIRYMSNYRVYNNYGWTFSNIDTLKNIFEILEHTNMIENSILEKTFHPYLTYFINSTNTMHFGYENNRYYSQLMRNYSLLNSEKKSNSIQLHSIYLQDKIKYAKHIAKFGIRVDYSTGMKKWYVQPRIAFSIDFGTFLLKSSMGKYFQYLVSINTSNSELVQYLEYYNTIKDAEPKEADHYIVGIENKIRENINLSITGYYKNLNVLYNYNPSVEEGPYHSFNDTYERGKGKSYGLEVLLQGEIGGFVGWLSYSISKSKRSFDSIQDGKEYFFKGDRTHNFNLVGLIKVNRDFTASTTFQILSGAPHTWAIGKSGKYGYDSFNNQIGVYYQELTPYINNVRYPMIVKCNIGWKKRLRGGFGYHLSEYLNASKSYYTVKVENLLFLRKNPNYYQYDINKQKYIAHDINSLVPFPLVTIGYTIKF